MTRIKLPLLLAICVLLLAACIPAKQSGRAVWRSVETTNKWDPYGYFWWSDRQKEIRELLVPPNYCTNYFETPTGEILAYSEMQNRYSPLKWDDAVFLGYGKYHHTECPNE